MQCRAVLGSGAQCGREVGPSAEVCAYHRAIELRREARAFYLARLSAEDREALAIAAGLEGVDAEIAMLRVLIRGVAGAGDIEAFRRGVDSLCRVLATKHELDGRATDRLGARLEAVLETMARELGYEEGEGGEEPDLVGPGAGRPVTRTLSCQGRGSGGAPAVSGTLEGHRAPAQEMEAAALALRYQGGEWEALKLLHGRLEVAILAILLHDRALQLPSAMTLEELEEQSWIVLAELAQRWRPGVSFLGYFFRTFPGAIASYARRAQAAGRTEVAESGPAKLAVEAPVLSGAEGPEGPFWATDLASLPELEGQIVLLRAFEGQDMEGISRQVGVPVGTAYKLYERARGRLEGRRRSPEGRGSIAMRRLVQALHIAASPDGRLPARDWAMGAAGLKRLEYDKLMGRLEGAGAIRDRRRGHASGYLVERDGAATLARVGVGESDGELESAGAGAPWSAGSGEGQARVRAGRGGKG